MEAYNSAGSVNSPSGVYEPTIQGADDLAPLGPLSFSQFIGAIIAVITVLLLLLLLIFVIPGAFRKRFSNKNKYTETFDSDIDRVVCIDHHIIYP